MSAPSDSFRLSSTGSSGGIESHADSDVTRISSGPLFDAPKSDPHIASRLTDEALPPELTAGPSIPGDGSKDPIASTTILPDPPRPVSDSPLAVAIQTNNYGIKSESDPKSNDPANDEKTVISSPLAVRPEEILRGLSVADVARVLEGRTLDHFVLEQLIGGGGMGAVFRGKDSRLDRVVAIKVIPAYRRDPETLRRFRIEAQAAARLDHPNIARVYYVGEVESWNYIVFEFINGINVRDLVNRDGPLAIDDAVFFTRQVAEALQHAFDREVVHRDIKPSNLLVTPGGAIKLVDMGLARSTSLDRSSADMTASGVTLGTFDYISPEQAHDPRDADVRSDLYSLGCTLFFMLTGQPPFPEGTALQKLLSHGSQPPPDPRDLRPDLSDELVAILFKLMAKRPTDRYQRPSELIGDLILLAEMEHLPRSRTPGLLAVSPTIAQRSVLEANLPLIVSSLLLLISLFWLQNADPWTASFPLPQPIVAAGENEETATAPSLDSSVSPDRDIRRPAESDRGSDAMNSSSRSLNPSDEATNSKPTNASTVSAKSNVANSTTTPQANLAGTSNAKATGGDDRNQLTSTSQNSKPVKMVDAGYGPEPKSTVRPGSTPPRNESLPATSSSETPIETLIVTSNSGLKPSKGEAISASLTEAINRANRDPSIRRILIAANQVRPGLIKLERGGISIEASPGFSPILLWTTDGANSLEETGEFSGGLIQVGSFDLQCVGIEFRIVEADSRRRLSVWQVSSEGKLSLRSCTVTLEDPRQSSALATIEIRDLTSSGGANPSNSGNASPAIAGQSAIDRIFPSATKKPRDDRKTASTVSDPAQVSLIDCVVRGEGDFIRMPIGQRLEVRWDNGLLAVSGRMLLAGGARAEELRPPTVRVSLSNLTAFCRTGLAQVETTLEYPNPICLVRQARACAFALGSGTPLVRWTGLTKSPNIAELLQLRGDDNAYDVSVQTLCEWQIGSSSPVQLGFRDSSESWFQDRSLETIVRWTNPLQDNMPLHRRTARDYEQRGAMFMPGFEPTRLPSASTQSSSSSSP